MQLLFYADFQVYFIFNNTSFISYTLKNAGLF